MQGWNGEARRSYAVNRYLVVRSLIPVTQANELATLHSERGEWRQWPGHESCEGLPDVRRFLENMTGRLFETVGARGDCEIQVWVNRYGVGQSISRHKDRARNDERVVAGILNVCLAAPPAENGGELVLAIDDEEVRVFLHAGDAIAFDGARIEHWTTPLVATTSEPAPFRMVAVGRYYLRPH